MSMCQYSYDDMYFRMAIIPLLCYVVMLCYCYVVMLSYGDYIVVMPKTADESRAVDEYSNY